MNDCYSFYHITVATLPHPVLDNLKLQVDQQDGAVIHVLGSDENRPIGWQSRGNFGLKLSKVFEFLQNPALDDHAMILFTDAYDVAYFGTRNEIMMKYDQFSTPIVFGGEKYCNPDPHKKSEYPETTAEFPYLNSGLFIGRVWALRICMQDYEYNDAHDDQRYWTDKYLHSPEMISIDRDAKLFLNTVDMDMKVFSYENNRVHYRNQTPALVHVNGPDKQMINMFVQRNI
jgi:hypothetical protein